jgi:hypothetical protein
LSARQGFVKEKRRRLYAFGLLRDLMSFSRRLLHLGAPILDATGLAAGFGRPHKGVGEIVVSHAVTTDKRNVLFDEMYTAAPFLEALIRHYQSRGADIVSMDEALRRLSEGSDRYFVVFTFDDGYRDNLTRALPIFERLGLPFTVYVTTSFIDRSFPIWWGALREVIKNADRLSIDVFGLEIHAVSVNEKIRAYKNSRRTRRGYGLLSQKGRYDRGYFEQGSLERKGTRPTFKVAPG